MKTKLFRLSLAFYAGMVAHRMLIVFNDGAWESVTAERRTFTNTDIRRKLKNRAENRNAPLTDSIFN